MTIKTGDVKELERKLFEATADYDHDVTFTALRNIITFWMSTTCPSCREHIANELKSSIPECWRKLAPSQQKTL
jgi:hypothetical protein